MKLDDMPLPHPSAPAASPARGAAGSSERVFHPPDQRVRAGGNPTPAAAKVAARPAARPVPPAGPGAGAMPPGSPASRPAMAGARVAQPAAPAGTPLAPRAGPTAGPAARTPPRAAPAAADPTPPVPSGASVPSTAAALRPLAPMLFELQALALRESRFDAAATAVLSRLALRLRATRVTLAMRRDARDAARVLASSDGIDNDRRLRSMRSLMNAADEVMDREALVEAPSPSGQSLAPAVALASLLRVDEVGTALGMAFDLDDGRRAALICELRQPAQMAHRVLLRDAALFVGPLLMLKSRVDAPLLDKVATLLKPYDEKRRERRFATPLLIAAPIAAALVFAAVWPSTHHVVAPARIEGFGQRVVPAPLDGFLKSVDVRPGETVKAGQVLATLDDREAALQAQKTASERSQYERQYLDALTREDAAATEIARAKFEQAKAQDEIAQSRLALSRLVAPFDGVVLSGDLVSMVGSPVKRGQELMVVAPSQTWRVVAEVDENDITYLGVGQDARVLVAALAGASADFKVSRVSPVAQAVDGRNVFEVEGQLGTGIAEMRPGLRGIARIEAGRRAPLAVWWERASNALRRLLWTLMA